MNVLYVNSTVRKASRTAELAGYFLKKLGADFTEVRPNELGLPTVDSKFLEMRDKACSSGDYSHEVFLAAKQFASADIIVIAAPFWDLSFPASLKQYFEHINVLGLTFDYSPQGEPISLCKAHTLVYITTAGGPIFSDEFGYGYVKALAQTFYGIKHIVEFKAQGLDIDGSDVKQIMAGTVSEIDNYFEKME